MEEERRQVHPKKPAEGAARFGWERRDPRPRSTRKGRTLIGYGVAGSSYPANVQPSSAKAIVTADSRARIQLAASDLGTGTWTVLDQVATDTLGFAPDQIEMEIGDAVYHATGVRVRGLPITPDKVLR
jgi:xanthine dehydrogenase YagR molybdenum-binding subunit